MLIAQITDMHVLEPGQRAFGVVDTAAQLSACVARINDLDPAPDLVVATGDLVDTGSLAEYRHLREILAMVEAPVYLIPGNHDSRENLTAVFADCGYLPRGGEFLHYSIEDFPVRVVAADTVIPGEAGGVMDAPRLAWLSARLAEDRERPTILLMHHPPFQTGIVHMDHMNCAGADGLAEVIARHPQVERILCGHVHRAIQCRFAGTLAMIAPSTAFQVALDFDPRAAAHWTDEPGGFALHYWTPEGGLSSHVCYIDDPGPKRPFCMAV
jgi:Icc protein